LIETLLGEKRGGGPGVAEIEKVFLGNYLETMPDFVMFRFVRIPGVQDEIVLSSPLTTKDIKLQ